MGTQHAALGNMRIHILVASAAALCACGGNTTPLTSTFADASSDVAIDHAAGQTGPSYGSFGSSGAKKPGVVSHPGALGVGADTGDASSGESTDAGEDASLGADASTADGGSFACGSVTCSWPGQYCSLTKTGSDTSANCMQAPFSCTSGATCGCVSPFEAGTNGCSCADNGGAVTLTCNY
jgi:hypothetical protein